MAKIGMEYVDHFSAARAAGYDVANLDIASDIGNGFENHLRDAGHEVVFAHRNREASERDLRANSEGGDDAQVVDSVDVCLVCTHGTYDHGTRLLFDIQHDGWEADSRRWLLGDTCNLEWLMVYGCASINKDRPLGLLNLFQGLHIYCGAYSYMYDSDTCDECGRDTADNLTGGKPVSDSWLDGVSDWWAENHATVLSVERAAQYVDGDIDWPNTVLCSDHFWGYGTTRGDIQPSEQFMMVVKWTDDGIWDWG